jgi:uncharacterized membrane protein YkvA (DUF1232 family)
MLQRALDWARAVTRDVVALWLAARDPRVPPIAKLLAALVAAYALSPIDLIPDFIPVLGYLDDVVVVPAGILLTVRLIPAPVMADLRAQAALRTTRPASRIGAALVVIVWLVMSLAAIFVWSAKQ